MIAFALMDWLPQVITFICGGGAVGAVVALYKVRPEAGQIVVTAAQGALIVQTGVIDNLKKEIERLNGEINDLKKENDDLRSRVDSLLKNQNRHDSEIQGLTNGHDKKS